LTPIGLLGGSFNPAHPAHRSISLFALQRLGLKETWWLVSPGNPLKPDDSMAPLNARLRSAREAARHAPIRVTAIEAELGTRYTVDTLRALIRRYPKNQFIWLMGADNLQQFHRWKHWRDIARLLPIAVIARPGYDRPARFAVAMGWLRRFVHPGSQASNWTKWRPPALVIIASRPDSTSATAIRARNPRWHQQSPTKAVRDGLTRRLV
jgi:nicotinate-nucleotide adenylyltransferase